MINHVRRGKKYPVKEVVLHTSATFGSWHEGKSVEDMVKEIRSWHKDLGWRDIGYHRVIAPDGSIGVGRSLYDTGAHVGGHNYGTIGICLIPVNDHNGITKFEDYFTKDQEKALKDYLKELGELTKIEKVTGHNQYANKECPGFRVRTEDWV
jgi:N-acetylmuramoyl-L-alanine amidase